VVTVNLCYNAFFEGRMMLSAGSGLRTN